MPLYTSALSVAQPGQCVCTCVCHVSVPYVCVCVCMWVNIFLTICLHVEHGHTNWPTGRCNWRQPNRGERAFPPPPLQTLSLLLPRCCQPAGSHCYLISNAGFVFALPTGNNFSFNSSNAQTEPNQSEPNRFNRFAPAALANHRARSGHRYIYVSVYIPIYCCEVMQKVSVAHVVSHLLISIVHLSSAYGVPYLTRGLGTTTTESAA